MNSTTQSTTANTTSGCAESAPDIWVNVAVSVTFFALFVLTVVLYSLIGTAVVKHRKKLFSGQYYTFVLSMAVAETYTVASYALFGSLCNLVGYCPGSVRINDVIMSLCYVTWHVEILTDMAVASDRVAAICFFKRYSEIDFGRKKFFIIALIWIVALVVNVPEYGFDVAAFEYVPSIFSGVYAGDTQSPLAIGLIVALSGPIDYAVIGVCATLYAVAIAYLIYRRKQSTDAAAASGGTASWRAQKNLMVQGICHFSTLVMIDVFFGIADSQMGCTYGWYLAATLMYMADPPVNAVLLIVLNTSIRERVAELVKKKTTTTVQTVKKVPSRKTLTRVGPSSARAEAAV